MAETSITEASLKDALTERLKATHVEVTDMSGERTPFFTAAAEAGRRQHQAMPAHATITQQD